ncbi:UNVERIFIED_CONTAM: hypothetical protein Scaly_0600900 [Sesamum calycinum]|uniref:N-acetyltransferase domain-containing protein n=1 Tax=Sesamum calycinum TaxID=2727403 RepID=A0AAW2RSE5_9LAMI
MSIQIPPPFPPQASLNLSSKHLYGGVTPGCFRSFPRCIPAFAANCPTKNLKWQFHPRQVELIGRLFCVQRHALKPSSGLPRVSASGHSTTSKNRHLASNPIPRLSCPDLNTFSSENVNGLSICGCDQLFPLRFSQKGEDRVVVGTLDLNQCISLPDEITGMKPKGIGADFARAYISNVCVAKELHRNGLGYELIAESKVVAEDWKEKQGISDLYVHVAVDNEAAKNLYLKSGFTLESDEPAWQARFLDRPRRLLLWIGLPITYGL